MSCYINFSMIERRTDDKAPQSDASNMIDVQFKQTKELDKKSRYLKASGHCVFAHNIVASCFQQSGQLLIFGRIDFIKL